MSVVLTDAKVFFAGYDLSGQHNRIELTHEVEPLDNTTFGSTTRTRTKGLFNSRATGAGFWQAGTGNVDAVTFESLALDGALVMLFPEAITEGATSTGSGYMFKVTESRVTFGGAVGDGGARPRRAWARVGAATRGDVRRSHGEASRRRGARRDPQCRRAIDPDRHRH